jgi:arylsulfatase A-like enzyme
VVPTLLGKEQKPHDYLYWEFFERGFDQAIRVGDWKGVRNGLDGPLQLYNLKDDVGEGQNVAEKNADVVAKLEAMMKAARTDSVRWVPKKGSK